MKHMYHYLTATNPMAGWVGIGILIVVALLFGLHYALERAYDTDEEPHLDDDYFEGI